MSGKKGIFADGKGGDISYQHSANQVIIQADRETATLPTPPPQPTPPPLGVHPPNKHRNKQLTYTPCKKRRIKTYN